MLGMVFRAVAFVAALLLTVDFVMPPHRDAARVDGHSISDSSAWRPDQHGPRYWLHFAGAHVDTCQVGMTTHRTVRDGDEVEVSSSRVFHVCERLLVNGREVDSWGRRWALFGIGGPLFLVALGWPRRRPTMREDFGVDAVRRILRIFF